MAFDILTFALDKVIATNKGVSDQRATQLALVGAVLPVRLLPSVLITQAIAQREAETSTPPSTPQEVLPDPTYQDIKDAPKDPNGSVRQHGETAGSANQ